jgi:hypothetical protein
MTEKDTEQSAVQSLLNELKNTPPGPLDKEIKDKIIGLLADCWPELKGGNDTSMAGSKLHGRAEDLVWDPPKITFKIERHGATVLGSTRAKLQQWAVDLQKKTAECFEKSYRQLTATSPRLDVKPIIARVIDAVQHGAASNHDFVQRGIVVWKSNNHVLIKHGDLIPSGGYQQTVAGRRRRFRIGLVASMKNIGWELVDVKRAMEFRKSH